MPRNMWGKFICFSLHSIGGHSGGLDKPNFRFSLPNSQLMAKAIPVRGAKFKKPAFEQAFCFFASLTLTQHRIQPGKHLVDNDARYAFQTLAFPYRLPTPRVSSVSAPQLSLKKRLPVG
ncbi:hypothetical protein [Klebsiella pneumoniae]|uniref:hypothetical protein n=2 Tax=Klebsiella pneumoniae TaxID=573 RepID=UPI001F5F743B|nr:hypothetical protein [Klebsiella pneumoniae]MDP1160392.1 hypothetical protein [Klebsiella pneumoniae]